MTSTLWFGLAAVILGGALQGVFAVPMKYAPRWNWENIWLIFALSGMIVFPWILTSATVPHPAQVYALSTSKTLISIAGFGACWGVGATLTGVGLDLLGIGLGMAIILGLSASIGSLIPFLVQTPQQIYTRQGHDYLLGTAIMLVGIAVCAHAGSMREALKKATSAAAQEASKASFVVGFIVCVLSGILSSALNFSYAFGGEAVKHALALGASKLWSVNVVTALAVTGGFAANFIYCAFLLRKNRSAGKFIAKGAGIGWLCGALMGFFWLGGQALYGLGISSMGSLGVVIGWPLLMGMIIVVSNAAGVLTGEWKGTSPATMRFLAAGMFIILAALGVLSLAQRA